MRIILVIFKTILCFPGSEMWPSSPFRSSSWPLGLSSMWSWTFLYSPYQCLEADSLWISLWCHLLNCKSWPRRQGGQSWEIENSKSFLDVQWSNMTLKSSTPWLLGVSVSACPCCSAQRNCSLCSEHITHKFCPAHTFVPHKTSKGLRKPQIRPKTFTVHTVFSALTET